MRIERAKKTVKGTLLYQISWKIVRRFSIRCIPPDSGNDGQTDRRYGFSW